MPSPCFQGSSEPYLTETPEMKDLVGPEVNTKAALSEEGGATISMDFSLEFVGPQWDRIPGKNE